MGNDRTFFELQVSGMFSKGARTALTKSAEIAFALDKEMSSIREEVNEAQSLFDDKQKRLD